MKTVFALAILAAVVDLLVGSAPVTITGLLLASVVLGARVLAAKPGGALPEQHARRLAATI